MYNILIASGAGVLGYLLGYFVTNHAFAGFLPALLAFVVVFIVLARRTGKQLETHFHGAMALMQAGKIDEARAALEAAMPLGKWQILVAEQIHSQLGSLDYLQGVGNTVQRQPTQAKARFAAGRTHLEKAWSRDWRAKATLAAIHHREGRPDDAVKVLEQASGPGRGEALYWGLYTFILNEARRRDEALQVIGRGVAENKDNKVLKQIQEALANKRRPDMKVLGESWYQMFPEDIPREKLMEMQGIKPQGRPQKTFPQPRR